MDLYEYQARNLFRQHGVPVLDGAVATTPEEARSAAQSLLDAGSELVVVKAQVKTGGRGKAGGVKLARTADEAEARARDILGMDIKGHTVRAVLISDGVDLDAEYYFSILLDRAERQYLAMCSREGGMDIETLAAERPEALARIGIDPLEGITPAVSHRIVEAAGFEAGVLADEVAAVIERLWEVFTAEDATLVEVNPLVKAADGRIIALDGKVTLDDNSRFRHPDHAELVDNAATDPLEARAREAGLNYVRLEGEVGVLGNGAGLVMSVSSTAIIGSAHPRYSGMASAMEEVSYEFGTLLSVAVLGSLMQLFYSWFAPAQVADSFESGLANPQLFDAAYAAFNSGFTLVMLVVAAVSATVAGITAWLLHNNPKETDYAHE